MLFIQILHFCLLPSSVALEADTTFLPSVVLQFGETQQPNSLTGGPVKQPYAGDNQCIMYIPQAGTINFATRVSPPSVNCATFPDSRHIISWTDPQLSFNYTDGKFCVQNAEIQNLFRIQDPLTGIRCTSTAHPKVRFNQKMQPRTHFNSLLFVKVYAKV